MKRKTIIIITISSFLVGVAASIKGFISIYKKKKRIKSYSNNLDALTTNNLIYLINIYTSNDNKGIAFYTKEDCKDTIIELKFLYNALYRRYKNKSISHVDFFALKNKINRHRDRIQIRLDAIN